MDIRGYLLAGIVGVMTHWWLRRAYREALPRPTPKRVVLQAVAPTSDRERVEHELIAVANALGLVVDRCDAHARSASSPDMQLEYRIGGGLTSHLRIELGRLDWPPFTLVAPPHLGPPPPSAVRQRLAVLRARVDVPPFAGASPPSLGADFDRAARCVVPHIELLEHASGVIDVWITSWSPEQAIQQIQRVMQFASVRTSGGRGPYR
jgi:hypothetical protein